MKITSYVLLAWLSSVAIVHAEEVSVRYDKGTYFLTAEFYVEASPARVMEVLTDYENITDLNSTINVSELLEFPDNSMIRIRTVVHDCILFFCKDISSSPWISIQATTSFNLLLLKLPSNTIPVDTELNQ